MRCKATCYRFSSFERYLISHFRSTTIVFWDSTTIFICYILKELFLFCSKLYKFYKSLTFWTGFMVIIFRFLSDMLVHILISIFMRYLPEVHAPKKVLLFSALNALYILLDLDPSPVFIVNVFFTIGRNSLRTGW